MQLDSALALKRQLMAGNRRLVARALQEERGAKRSRSVAMGVAPGAGDGEAREVRRVARALPPGGGIAIGVTPLAPAARSALRAARGAKSPRALATAGQYKLSVRILGATRQQVEPMLGGLANLSASEVEIIGGLRYAPRAPLAAGNSCGHFNITAGTLGLFVEDERDYFVLSNNHVLADSDNGKRGDAVYAPGNLDLTGEPRTIAELTRWPRFKPSRRDNVDVALARLLPEEVEEFYPYWYQGIGDMDPRPIADRFATRRVIKRGRTTKVTRGTVSAFDLDGVQLDYGPPAGMVTFDDQLEFIHEKPKQKDFSAGGDSGSLILDADNLRPYALLFGGGPDEQDIDRTLGHFLEPLLKRLKVRLVT
jgi:hypothetical protein